MSFNDLYTRLRPSLIQFLRFGLVGGCGVLVNQAVFIACNVIGRDAFGTNESAIVVGIMFTELNVRNYHIWSTLAFLVANLFNFVVNRHWTFKSADRAPFWKEYLPFLSVGLFAQGIGLLILTALMHPDSPISLPTSVFTGEVGLLNKLYWANLITVICVTPINFTLNKLWTFRIVRRRHQGRMGE
ncbi:MAG: GtrA family protein [Propionibacteriaceae bacterium]|nr:GtrA family protein [Propionibacteriaceae bacterium]